VKKAGIARRWKKVGRRGATSPVPAGAGMRVTYIHQYFKTPSSEGGTRSYELARRLVAHGYAVTMITSAPAASHAGIRRTNESGIDVVWIPVPYSNAMGYGRRLRSFVEYAVYATVVAIRVPADVVYASSTPLTVAIPGVITSLARRAPMVFEVRDLWPEVPIALGILHGPIAPRLARGLQWFAYRGSAWIVALSPQMATGVEARGYEASRISVIPNGCDTELFQAVNDETAPYPSEVNDRPGPKVLYPGAFGAVNDVGWLAGVAAALGEVDPKVTVIAVGSGPEKQRVVDRGARSGVLGRNFFVLDPIRKADMPSALAQSDIVLSLVADVPELEANSANKVFDALAAGRPVGINHGGWLADLIREERCGLVLDRDPVLAARALADFLGDEVWMNTARANATRLARGRFSRDRQADQLIEILDHIAFGSRGIR
jgi:glycosyltransferase involved in cell wall biosynthesis